MILKNSRVECRLESMSTLKSSNESRSLGRVDYMY